MTKLILELPGQDRYSVVGVATEYIVTVRRVDGIKCAEVEAKTAMKMLCEPLERRRSKFQTIDAQIPT